MTSATDEPAGTRILRGAVAGLVAGVVASFAMDAFQSLASSLLPSDSDEEPATAKAADRVRQAAGGAPVTEQQQPLAGQIVHYVVGAALGAGYGIAAEFRPAVTAGFGAPFGFGLAAVLDEAVVPAVGLGSPPWETPPSTHAYTLASHLLFGTVTEFTRRQLRATLLPSAG